MRNFLLSIFSFLFLISQITFAEPLKLTQSKFIVYWGGWMGMTYDLNALPQSVNVVNLAFANINTNNQVDTLISGSITNIPTEDGGQMQPSYINWTKFKYNRPDTKIILSVGGSTFESIWTNVLTQQSADAIAKNIAHVVNQSYPVYRGNFAGAADKLGEVNIDGIDLDVETGGARLSNEVSNNVVLLIQSLKKYLGSEKIITFTGFSVGADSNDAQCTVAGSVHCGEDISILTRTKDDLNWVNVMAYDAGKDYANSKYQLALSNYANYVGKNKTVLGLDIQPQWDQLGTFQETAAQLAEKAAWQKANQYAGAMFWAVNITNDPTLEQTYIDLIASQL